MSAVIEVMAGTAMADVSPQARMAIKSALRAAEKAGWRLVPVEATPDMVVAIRDHLIDFSGRELWHQTIEAAPRPWDGDDS